MKMGKNSGKEYWPQEPSKYNLELEGRETKENPVLVVIAIVMLGFILALIMFSAV